MEFSSFLDTTSNTLSVSNALICMGCALILGMAIAFVHTLSGKYTKNFIITLAVLPLLVQVVIMMVNGNLGTSVAVLGSFTLIRFRSMPGTSRELISVFFAMAVGLAVGMGHVLYAVVFTIFTGLVLYILQKSKYGEKKQISRILKISVPENLNFSDVFNNSLKQYTTTYYLDKVKTINLGSMYELTYRIILKEENKLKELIDDIRIKNGNLNVFIGNDNNETEL